MCFTIFDSAAFFEIGINGSKNSEFRQEMALKMLNANTALSFCSFEYMDVTTTAPSAY